MRFALILSALFFATGLAVHPAVAQEAAKEAVVTPASLKEHFLGDAAAPVTLIEYASLTCSHCAHFHKEILPKLTEKYITTGKVKLVYRDFPLDGMALKAAQLTHCMPEDRYFPFLKTLFDTQENWTHAQDIDATLVQYAKLAGLSGDRAAACLKDKNILEALVQQRVEAEKKFQIDATPSFIVNYGEGRLTGANTFEAFEKDLLKYVKNVKPVAETKPDETKPEEVKPEEKMTEEKKPDEAAPVVGKPPATPDLAPDPGPEPQ
jgi:protein-disulfide isomerase